jgi:hypothetical protein
MEMVQGIKEAGFSRGAVATAEKPLPLPAIMNQPPLGDAREDRIRAVFSLRGATDLPRVDKATLQNYFQHLATQLSLPFDALYYDETGPAVGADCRVSVVGLPPPSQYPFDPMAGLFCTVRTSRGEVHVPLADIRVGEDHANHRMVEDYWYWFWNWR